MSISTANNCYFCPVFKNSLFKDFDEPLTTWLSNKKKMLDLNKKDVLFNQGEPVEGLFCHLEGIAKVDQKDEKGNIKFTRLVLPGDTSGHRSLFIEKEYKGTAVVISENLKACFINNSDILQLISNNPSMAKNLIIKISQELNRSELEVISVKEKNVRCRLAYLLYNLATEYAEEIDQSQRVLKSEITKKDIAGLLMVANETVIRLMSEMKSEGLISYEDKRIVINDIDKIKVISRINTEE